MPFQLTGSLRQKLLPHFSISLTLYAATCEREGTHDLSLTVASEH